MRKPITKRQVKADISRPCYVALIHKEESTSYGIMFPDFPGCISVGDTPEEAFDNGREALALHVEGMKQDGQTIPMPRSLESIQQEDKDWVDFNGAIVALVPLIISKNQTIRVNINIDTNLLAATDLAAQHAGQTRSAFIARALGSALEG
ncbi:MAG: type II toxin-antitoxin system HicB family antitoxin [Bdellovibrionales bacterium]